MNMSFLDPSPSNSINFNSFGYKKRFYPNKKYAPPNGFIRRRVSYEALRKLYGFAPLENVDHLCDDGMSDDVFAIEGDQ